MWIQCLYQRQITEREQRKPEDSRLREGRLHRGGSMWIWHWKMKEKKIQWRQKVRKVSLVTGHRESKGLRNEGTLFGVEEKQALRSGPACRRCPWCPRSPGEMGVWRQALQDVYCRAEKCRGYPEVGGAGTCFLGGMCHDSVYAPRRNLMTTL